MLRFSSIPPTRINHQFTNANSLVAICGFWSVVVERIIKKREREKGRKGGERRKKGREKRKEKEERERERERLNQTKCIIGRYLFDSA
jgi:hypothetical protein